MFPLTTIKTPQLYVKFGLDLLENIKGQWHSTEGGKAPYSQYVAPCYVFVQVSTANGHADFLQPIWVGKHWVLFQEVPSDKRWYT